MTRTTRIGLVIVAALAAALPLRAEWSITEFTVDGGGGVIEQDEWTVHATIGQHDAGALLTGDAFALAGGFWPAGAPSAPCFGDVDLDGSVGFADLVSVLATWGACPPTCPEDIDDDGVVGFTDLVALLAAWGPCG